MLNVCYAVWYIISTALLYILSELIEKFQLSKLSAYDVYRQVSVVEKILYVWLGCVGTDALTDTGRCCIHHMDWLLAL